MNIEELKQWIRDNLEIKIAYQNDGACHFELWIAGDKKPFSSDYLYLDD